MTPFLLLLLLSSSFSWLPALHVRSPSTSSHLWLPQASAHPSRPTDRQSDRHSDSADRTGRQWVAVGEKFSLLNWSLRHDKAASLCNKCVLMGHRSSAFTFHCKLPCDGCCSPLRGFKLNWTTTKHEDGDNESNTTSASTLSFNCCWCCGLRAFNCITPFAMVVVVTEPPQFP